MLHKGQMSEADSAERANTPTFLTTSARGGMMKGNDEHGFAKAHRPFALVESHTAEWTPFRNGLTTIALHPGVECSWSMRTHKLVYTHLVVEVQCQT